MVDPLHNAVLQIDSCVHIAYRYREEEESFYIHVPSPIGLIGWNIQHMPKVFEEKGLRKAYRPIGLTRT